jgi:hypothetical protein
LLARVGSAEGVMAMDWFRSRARSGAYLALFALAVQLAVCFGHVHLDGIAFARAPVLEQGQAAAVAATAPDPAGSEMPALADDCCVVCALIHLAGTLVTPEAPPLPLPVRSGRLRFAPPAAFDPTGTSFALFQARAPPIA